MNKKTQSGISTQSTKKIKDFFEDLRRNEHFLKRVKLIRSGLKMPENGLIPDLKDIEKISRTDPFYWPRKIYGIDPSLRLGYIHQISKITSDMLQKFPVNNLYMDLTLRTFIFHNKFLHEFNIADDYLNAHNTISISPSEDIFNEYAIFDSNKVAKDIHIKKIQDEVKQYPVYIKISSEASLNDTLDFINKNFTKNIQPILSQYGDKKPMLINRKVNKKNNNRDRDDFIYANRHLKRSQIYSKLLSMKMAKNIDEAGVGKIISIETKKRNKV